MGATADGRAHRWRWLVALALSLLVALVAHAPAAGAKPPNYVALGDSYTAGPLIPLQIPPFGCLKSDHNYPHLAAPDLPVASLRDPSCSGATTEDMTQPQDVDPDGPNPPQLDSLDANTRIASLGIGGNDIGFSEIAENCTSDSPYGHPCQDRYVVNGDDEIHDRIVATAPKVAAVLQGIHARAPDATVYVVNYLPIFPETGNGCWPQVPVAYDDVPYLRAKQKELNQMLADQASANGAKLVDAYTAGIGHDACQLPLIRWVEPAVPNSPAAPLHPNLFGMQGTAQAFLKTVHSH
jgi:lysophospholipase L1-like esterase